MQTLERGEDKLKRICNQLRQETLEPAKLEALRILADAREQAAALLHETKEQINREREQSKKQIEMERKVFESSLLQASKQAVSHLKRLLEEKLINPELDALVDRTAADPILIATIIESLAKAVEKEGIHSNLIAYIPASIQAGEVAQLLAKHIMQKFKGQSLEFGDFKGGAKLVWLERKMTFDMSEDAIKELIGNYLRNDLRRLFFGQG